MFSQKYDLSETTENILQYNACLFTENLENGLNEL